MVNVEGAFGAEKVYNRALLRCRTAVCAAATHKCGRARSDMVERDRNETAPERTLDLCRLNTTGFKLALLNERVEIVHANHFLAVPVSTRVHKSVPRTTTSLWRKPLGSWRHAAAVD